eukprot:GHVN01057271.1.p1 GENE.GHVN01057271.1~~GHVN01057271.1.p1  ORF type:complete len:586 (+),score=50.95 GHVN01057271.1:200-1957(+)
MSPSPEYATPLSVDKPESLKHVKSQNSSPNVEDSELSVFNPINQVHDRLACGATTRDLVSNTPVAGSQLNQSDGLTGEVKERDFEGYNANIEPPFDAELSDREPSDHGDSNNEMVSAVSAQLKSMPAASGSSQRTDDAPAIELLTEPNPYSLPAEALLFEPATSDIVHDGLRFIYLNTELDEKEQKYLAALRRHLHTESRTAAPAGLEARCSLDPMVANKEFLRYLYSENFQVVKAAAMVHENCVFRSTQLPVSEAEVIEGLKRGGAYWHGRDKNMRPLLVLKVMTLAEYKDSLENAHKLHHKHEHKHHHRKGHRGQHHYGEHRGRHEQHGEHSAQRDSAYFEGQAARIIIFCFEFFIRHLQVAGRAENWNVIIDCEGKGLGGFPTSTLKFLISLLNSRYRGRLFKLFVVNFPKYIQWISGVVLQLAPGTTAKKLVLASGPDDYQPLIRQLYAPNQLEVKYGGSVPNIPPKDVYPFRFYPGPYRVSRRSGDVGDEPTCLHNVVAPQVHAGDLWELPPNFSQFSEQEKQAFLAEPPPQSLWVKNVRGANLTNRSAKWVHRHLGFEATPVTTVNQLRHTDGDNKFSQ